MTAGRPLRAVPAGPDVLAALPAALDGSGPALLPLPVGAPREVVARLLEVARLEQPVEHDDVALVVPTSGSTGEPKLALLTSRALRASATATLERLGGPGEWVLALPLTHVAGLQVAVRSLLAGSPPLVADTSTGFSAATLEATRSAGSGSRTYLSLVPTQLHRLVDTGTDLSWVSAVLLGGAAADDALVAAGQSLGTRVVRTYGMTETCGGCVYDGVPLGGVRVEVGTGSRVRIAGATLARGYRLRPDLDRAAFADGWFVTSDVGELDAGGRLRVLGRVDDVVVTGGEKVAAATVEAALRAVPGVRDAVVAGVPDAEWGQVVAAVVEISQGGAGVSGAELQAVVRDALGPVAVPRRLVVVAALPRTGLGKPDRRAARVLLGLPADP